ncbi:MAG: hypothetical protein CMK07_03885 [Ponticaulis sp.]|nr:hypothetical protein [Ponticaulis sp.]
MREEFNPIAQKGLKTFRNSLSAGLLALLSDSAIAEDDDKSLAFTGEVGLASMFIDRGEQLGAATLTAALGAEKEISGVVLYGGVSLINPVGDDREPFDEEVDYTIGAAWDGPGYSADVSANWLTYPGEASEESLEIAGSLTFDQALSPTLATFYDAEFEDWGLEFTAGPEWLVSDWTLYTLGRLGFVEPGDGSQNRTYAGVEAGASRPLFGNTEFGVFSRYEWANQDSFADDISNGVITSVTDSGFAVGIALTSSY